jgi:hypothetical protein
MKASILGRSSSGSGATSGASASPARANSQWQWGATNQWRHARARSGLPGAAAPPPALRCPAPAHIFRGPYLPRLAPCPYPSPLTCRALPRCQRDRLDLVPVLLNLNAARGREGDIAPEAATRTVRVGGAQRCRVNAPRADACLPASLLRRRPKPPGNPSSATVALEWRHVSAWVPGGAAHRPDWMHR